MSGPRIAAAVVTYNGAAWIREVLTSILDQSTGLDQVVVVDDHSVDATCEIIRATFGAQIRLIPSQLPRQGTTSVSIYTRIAANFVQAVRECGDAELVALADQDDVWHRDRVAAQIEGIGSATMIASDGALVDDSGRAIGGTLRSVFPIPAGFAASSPAQRMRMALRHSIATGSASVIRPRRLAESGVLDAPPGWLHDRWWSLAACALDSMVVDDTPVIDYRISGEQVVGLDRRAQQGSRLARLVDHGRRARESMAKVTAVHDRLAPIAASAPIRAELTVTRMARTVLAG